MTGWPRLCESPMSANEIERIIRDDPDCGIGLALGCNDLVAVDVDSEKAYGAVREVFGGIRPPTKKGRKGATAFFRGSIKSRKFREAPFENEDGKIIRPTLVEILAYGNQTVIPGTIHPDTGKPYRWVSGSLEDIRHPHDLPVITPDHIEQLAELLAPLMPEFRDEREPVEVRDPNLSPVMRRRYEGNARAALEAETLKLANTAKPGRNDALFHATLCLGKYVHHGIIEKSELVSALMAACEQNGLTRDNGRKDAINTIHDGIQWSRNHPLPELQERPYDERN